MAAPCIQGENNFITAFTTRSPFRYGLLDLLDWRAIATVDQAFPGTLNSADRAYYLNAVGLTLGSANLARHMKSLGFSLHILGPEFCDTARRFVEHRDHRWNSIVLVTSDETGRVLSAPEVAECMGKWDPDTVMSWNETVHAFFTVTCRARFRDEDVWFQLPDPAALSGTTRSVMSWRPAGVDRRYSRRTVFDPPRKHTRLRLLKAGSAVDDSPVRTVAFFEYSEAAFDRLINDESSKTPVLAFKPADWQGCFGEPTVFAAIL